MKISNLQKAIFLIVLTTNIWAIDLINLDCNTKECKLEKIKQHCMNIKFNPLVKSRKSWARIFANPTIRKQYIDFYDLTPLEEACIELFVLCNSYDSSKYDIYLGSNN